MNWRSSGSARPDACQAQGRAPQDMAAVTSSRQRQHTTDLVTFYNGRGQAVGVVRDGWLEKHVRTPVHQLRTPPAWAVDAAHLDQLEVMGAAGVRLLDEQGTEWRATVRAFRDYGIPIDRGHGTQVALPLARWRRSVAGQRSLFELLDDEDGEVA